MSKQVATTAGIRTTTYPFSEEPETIVEVPSSDREVLRRLVHRKMEIATEPENLARKELWYRHSALEETRPMILAEIQAAHRR